MEGVPRELKFVEPDSTSNNESTTVDVSLNSSGVGLEDQAQRSSHFSGEWEYAQDGTYVNHDNPNPDDSYLKHLETLRSHQLDQIPATSISGNDITSSCLYVVGLSAASSGKFSPIALALVAFVLWMFRGVYSEVGTALPLNGGAYNILLNTTSKNLAALAACLTLLSYVATAVVSGSEATEYAQDLYYAINPFWATPLLLFVFCCLNLVGITESSRVATAIFFVHCGCMLVLIVLCTVRAFESGWALFIDNWSTPPIRSNMIDIFFGFCTGLLGVSGFETSANFIEEQKPGVFAKTLRNMWVAVAFFNPCLSLLALAMVPLRCGPGVNQCISDPSVQRVLLSVMGQRAAGRWLGILISADAFLVLAGAVLTSYVGVTGLVRRMAMDRLLPNFLLQQNPWTQTNHWIIIIFCFLTTSLYLLVPDVSTLGGVYTVAFLSVMALFAIGNMLLKYKRSQIPREHKTSWLVVVTACLSVVVALVGNIVYDWTVLKYFSMYFSATMFIIFVMVMRIKLLKFLDFFLRKVEFLHRFLPFLRKEMLEIKNINVVFYTRGGELSTLNKAIIYIIENEITDKISIIHFYEHESEIPTNLRQNVEAMDECYPKLTINLHVIRGKFSPVMVDWVEKNMHIPKNLMFITCPDDDFEHRIGDFGGVRLVTH